MDPEQNEGFNDHYLDMDYDLSKVMFICTANSLHGIPAPLQDRLEIIRLAGYTEPEKLSIVQRYLLPKQLTNHGIQAKNLVLTKQAAMQIVRRYTKEAGVRNLDREIASVCRKVARRVVTQGSEIELKVTSGNIEKLLGPPRFRYGTVSPKNEVGFVQGLAWTQAGGVMVPIEAAAVRGSGKTTLTGKLGNVFQESSQAAVTYIRARSANLGLAPDFYQQLDVHVHVPELWGVDGPSAGITIATALVSAFTGIPVCVRKLMVLFLATGEWWVVSLGLPYLPFPPRQPIVRYGRPLQQPSLGTRCWSAPILPRGGLSSGRGVVSAAFGVHVPVHVLHRGGGQEGVVVIVWFLTRCGAARSEVRLGLGGASCSARVLCGAACALKLELPAARTMSRTAPCALKSDTCAARRSS